jgi:CHAT domain-containing protein/tetratricopeptide (TPR) repeat protein
MILSPVSRRFTPRFRGVPCFFLLLAALLCGAAPPPSTAGPNLTEGLVLERDLKGGETHIYPVDLQAGQFLRVRVQEEGIDVIVRLLDSTGAVVTGSNDVFTPRYSDEDLAVVASVSGHHRVEVASAQEKASPGRYRLRVEGPRTAGDQDKVRSEAVRAFWEANRETGKDEETLRREIRSVERAVPLWHQLGETRREAEALYFLSIARFKLSGDAEQSLADFQASASLWGAQPDREALYYQIRSLNSMGGLLKRLGRPDEARQRYQEALTVARQVGDVRNVAASLNNLGLLDCDQGEPRRGIESLTESLAKAREIQDRDIQASDLINLAFAYEQLQDKQKALQYEQEALELARAVKSRDFEATALNNLADTYASFGELDGALRYYQQALAINRKLPDRSIEATALNNVGTAYLKLERFEEARRYFDQALALSRKTKDLEVQTAVLNNQALLALRTKRPARAVELATEGLRLAHGFRMREALALYALGEAHRETGDLRQSREELDRALALFRERGDQVWEAETNLALARLEVKQHDPAAALPRLETGIGILESVRAQVVNPELRTSLLAYRQSYYELQIDTLMSLQSGGRDGSAVKALQVSERARARGLLEILNESGADIRRGASPELVERERRLRDEVNARDRYHFNLLGEEKPDKRKLEEAERKLENVLDEYNRAQADLRASSPSYAALTQPQPLSVAEIQTQVLDGKALLLEYALGAKRSFLWVVTPEAIRSFELPGRERIEKTARRYYELLTARNVRRPEESLQAWKQRIDGADAEAGRVGRDLSRLLLGPAERLLGDRPLLIVADGALQYIPFAALPIPSSGAPLVTRHEVVSLPSASALAVLRREVRGRPRAQKTLAIFADPVFQKNDPRLTSRSAKPERMSLASRTTRGWSPADARQGGESSSFRRLPSSRKEAETIAALVPKDQLFLAVGFDASRAKATGPELARYRIVHFATHGVLDSRQPKLSKLVLSLYDAKGRSEDGFLRLNDIYALHLDADLVVLSACQTALGKEIRGEGLVGLTRGFMDAGAARVLASLWSVEDRATAELMGSFYRAMLRDKLSPTAALRQAQIQMASSPGRQSPYFWAGFSLQGEWK